MLRADTAMACRFGIPGTTERLLTDMQDQHHVTPLRDTCPKLF